MYDLRLNLSFFLIRICFNPRALAGGRDRLPHLRRPGNAVSIPAPSREDATVCRICGAPAMPFQSPRPRGRTRRLRSASKKSTGRFNPRVLAGGRDALPPLETAAQRFQSPRPRGRTRHSVRFVFLSRVMFQSPCPYNLAISQSRNLAIMDCSLQAVGERKVKTMAKICQAETAIRGSLRVHDKRKPLNARRMPMHSFVSTPLQGTLDPME